MDTLHKAAYWLQVREAHPWRTLLAERADALDDLGFLPELTGQGTQGPRELCEPALFLEVTQPSFFCGLVAGGNIPSTKGTENELRIK